MIYCNNDLIIKKTIVVNIVNKTDKKYRCKTCVGKCGLFDWAECRPYGYIWWTPTKDKCEGCSLYGVWKDKDGNIERTKCCRHSEPCFKRDDC